MGGLVSVGSIVDSLVFIAGGLLLIALVRRWAGVPGRRAALVHLSLTALFFAVPLLTTAYQLPLDVLYRLPPWNETLGRPVSLQNPLLTDVPLQMIPFRALVRERLLAGEAPLWAHELGTGQPLLGNGQSAPFAPLHLLALPLPTLRAMTVAAAWQVLLALLLTHALLRTLGAGAAGSTFGAVAYAFSTFAMAWLYHPHGMVAAMVPGVFLSLLWLRTGERKGFIGLVGWTVAMLLSGQPEVVAHAALGAGVLWLAALARPAAGVPRRAFVLRSVGAGLLIVALTAPVTLPLLADIPHSERMILLARGDDTGHDAPFRPAALLPTLSPLVFGSPREGNWRGHWNFNETCTHYAGALTLVIALAGAVVLRGRAALLVVAGGLALFAALGLRPLHTLLVHLPLFAHAGHGRLRLLWDLALALAAGLVLERLVATRGARRLTLVLLAAMAGALLLLRPVGETSWQTAWLTLALAGLVATFFTLATAPLRRFFPAVAVVAVVVELFALGARYHPLVPAAMDLQAPPLVRYLQAAREEASQPFRVTAVGGRFLPYLPAYYGLWDPRGFDPMRPGAALQLLRERLHRPATGGFFLQRFELDAPLHAYLGVRYVMAGSEPPPPPWRAVHGGVSGAIWENPQALPLFFFPARVESRADRDAALRFARRCDDFAARAVIEGSERPQGAQQGQVTIQGLHANGYELAVASPSGGVVASSVTWMPGWQLTVDGEPATVGRVNGAFLGFTVPAGSSHVRLHYAPGGWRWGWIFCALALAALGWLGLRARRRSQDDAGSGGTMEDLTQGYAYERLIEEEKAHYAQIEVTPQLTEGGLHAQNAWAHYWGRVGARLGATDFGNVVSVLEEHNEGVTRPLRVLSLGSGYCGHELELAERFTRPYVIHCTDINPDLFTAARERAAEQGLNLTFATADLNFPSIEPGSYDLIFAHAAIHHAINLERLFAAVAAGLTPNGLFHLVEVAGKNRKLIWDENERFANGLLALLPETVTGGVRLAVPAAMEGMEGLRQEDIPPLLAARFVPLYELRHGAFMRFICLDPQLSQFLDPADPTRHSHLDFLIDADESAVARGLLRPLEIWGLYRPRRQEGE